MLSLQVICSDLMPVIERSTDANLIVILISSFLILLLLLAVKVFYTGYYQDLLYLLRRSESVGTSFFSESNTSQIQAGIITQIASVLSIATALFTISAYTDIELNPSAFSPIVHFFITLIFVLAFVYFRILIFKLFAWLFDFTKPVKPYITYILNILKVFGVIIFPVFIVMPFVNINTRIGLAITILSLALISALLQYYIYFANTIKIKFFNHYSILYFCTLEILPSLFLLKLIGVI